MLYLLALIGLAAAVAVLWVTIGGRRTPQAPQRRVIAPDDDPEFLRRLKERRLRPPEEPES